MRCRPSARLLVLDPEGRVLLFRFAFSRGALAGRDFWATPGGGVDPGETFEQAAIRELREETGIDVDRVAPHVAEREFVLRTADGEHVLAQERYFLVRAGAARVSRAEWSAHEIETMAEHRWWPVAELARTAETVFPADLASMVGEAETPR